MTSSITENLIQQVASLSANEMMFLIAEANRLNDAKAKKMIAEVVANDIQDHIDDSELENACPECGSTHAKKNGKRNGIQRYTCKDCGHRFTSLSGTLLEKTYYSWDVWVAVIQAMMNGISIEKTRQILEDDYCCSEISVKTVRRMRLKVMYAISHLPAPKLSGVVQFDDTFFRESQKGSRNLVSPFPADFQFVREPRHGRVPSMLGVKGNDSSPSLAA